MNLFYQEYKNELFLSPHVRLCGLSGMAHVESKSLAENFAEACIAILQKRYGNETTIQVFECMGSETKSLLARISRDSAIIRKRLASNNFSPNKAP